LWPPPEVALTAGARLTAGETAELLAAEPAAGAPLRTAGIGVTARAEAGIAAAAAGIAAADIAAADSAAPGIAAGDV
jgi:hypothetical protein